jgi:hypothetical protein
MPWLTARKLMPKGMPVIALTTAAIAKVAAIATAICFT